MQNYKFLRLILQPFFTKTKSIKSDNQNWFIKIIIQKFDVKVPFVFIWLLEYVMFFQLFFECVFLGGIFSIHISNVFCFDDLCLHIFSMFFCVFVMGVVLWFLSMIGFAHIINVCCYENVSGSQKCIPRIVKNITYSRGAMRET